MTASPIEERTSVTLADTMTENLAAKADRHLWCHF
ncbi:MAG: hypothetical protein QOH07_2380, partial [Mycobacterium sp.]|nr:hypothetical protein [Mycobacterium sp.]